ncbi:MAG: hypothetical protein NTV37_07235, partial [Proteobacteria bacterium]|nr:hypothetical protein [Pseudomonadota bacterium]
GLPAYPASSQYGVTRKKLSITYQAYAALKFFIRLPSNKDNQPKYDSLGIFNPYQGYQSKKVEAKRVCFSSINHPAEKQLADPDRHKFNRRS